MAGHFKRLLPLLILFVLCAPARAQDRDSFLRLVFKDGRPYLRDGWHFVKVEPGRGGALYTYRYGLDQVVEVAVQPRSQRGHAFGATENLSITYTETGSASSEPEHAQEVYTFVRELVGVIGANEDGTLFQLADDAPEGGAQDEGALEKYISGPDGAIADFGEGWEYGGYAVHPDRISYSFTLGGKTLDVAISPLDSPHKAFSRTKTFKVWYSAGPGPAPDELEAFLARFVEVVDRNDDGSSPFGAVLQLGDDGSEESPRPLQRVLILFTFLLWFVFPYAVYRVGRALWAECTGLSRWEGLTIGLIFVVGLAVRLVAPAALVKVGMVYPLMESAIGLESLPRYGAAGPVLYNLLFFVFPIHTSSVLWLHCILGSLSVFLSIVFWRRMSGSVGAGMCAGLLLALTPVFVRDANSESLLVPAVFLLLVGGLLLQQGIRSRRVTDMMAGALSLALAGAFRPELVLVSLAFGAWVAWAMPDRPRGGLRRGLLALGGVAVLLLLQAAWVLTAADSEFARGNLQLHRLSPVRVIQELWTMGLVVKPWLFPVATVVFAVAGLVGSWVQRRVRLVWALAGLALLWLVTTYIDINEESVLRLHVPAAMLLSLIGGYGLAWLLSALRPFKARLVGAVVAALFFGVAAAATVPGVFFTTNSQIDGELFGQAVGALPPGPVRFVRLGPEDAPDHALCEASLKKALETRVAFAPVHRHYPDYLLRPPLRDDQVGPIGAIRDIQIKSMPAYFYLSVQCYAVLDAGGERGWGVSSGPYVALHPACRWALQNYSVRPVFLRVVENAGEYAAPFRWYPDTAGHMTLGLFELGESLERLDSRDPFVNAAHWYDEQARPLIVAGDMEQAASILAEGERLLPRSVAMWRAQASFHFLRGAQTEDPALLARSLEYWERIASADLHFPLLLSKMGAVFSIWAGHAGLDRAREYVEARLACDPDDTVAIYLRGVISFYADKDYDATREAMERVMKIVDNDPRVYIYLGLSHFYQGRQEKAEELVLKAVEYGEDQDPDVFYVRSIVFRHKDLDGAVRDIERYLEMSGEPGKVKFERKQKWLRNELENLKLGKPSPWWTTRTPDEPWNEEK